MRQEYFSSLHNIDIYLKIEESTASEQLVRKIDDYTNGRTEKYKNGARKGFLEAQNNDTSAEKKSLL